MAEFEPRGRIDLDRDSNLYRQRIQRQRIEKVRYPGERLAREDTYAEERRRQIHQKLPDMRRLAAMVVVASGAAMVGKAVTPARIIKTLAAAGEHGYNMRDKIVRPVRHMVDDVLLGHNPEARQLAREALGASTAGERKVNPDLLRELEHIYSKYRGIGTDAIHLPHGPGGTGIDVHRQFLSERYGRARLTPTGLKALTVDDIIQNKRVRKSFTEAQVANLMEATQSGLIKGDFTVSEGKWAGMYLDDAGKLVDTQWAKPARIFDAVEAHVSKIKVAGISPGAFFMGAFRPLVSDKKHLTIGNNLTLPAQTADGKWVKTGELMSFSMGDRIFTLDKHRPRFIEIAEGMKVYDIEHEGSKWVARSIASVDGTLASQMDQVVADRIGSKEGAASWWKQVQMAVGVGPEYQTHRAVWSELNDFVKRRETKSKFVPNRYQPREATMSWHEKAKAISEYRRQAELELARVRKDAAGGYGLPSAPSEIRSGAPHLRRGGGQYTQQDYSAGYMGALSPEEFARRKMKEAVPSEIHDLDDPLSGLSMWERLKAYANKSNAGKFYDELPDPSQHYAGVELGEPLHARRPMQGFTPAPGGVPLPVGGKGLPAKSVVAGGVVDVPGGLRTFNLGMHYMTERLNTLIGTTTGWGFRPTPGEYGWVGNLAKIYGVAAAGTVAIETGKYADYIAGEALDYVPGLDDTTPSQYAVKLYAHANIIRQRAREFTGVQPAAEYLEGLMPGSMTLPGSYAARTIGPVVAGGYKGGRMGAIAGGLLSLAIGGTDVEQSPEELAAIYSGEKDIPIMKARWWTLGLQPWSGNKIDHYQQHWVHRYLSDYRYTDVQYGSKSEYFQYESASFTPHNFFGLRKMLNPDYYAEKHYNTRPYPYAPSGKRLRWGEEVVPPVDRRVLQARTMGFDALPRIHDVGEDPTTIRAQTARFVDQVTELGGIWKFFAEQMPGYDATFSGDERHSEKYAANASTITSKSREYYDENLGGLLGMTELLRRFMDPDHGRQGVNLIPNTMPTWLPGLRSEFDADQDYYTDFTLGDPYAKIQQGEARLPGPGYEALRPLHSKTPGVYDALDRYLILSDVAPYSRATREYEAIVEGWAASGALDASWGKKFATAKEQLGTILDGPEYTPRIFSGTKSGTPEELARVNEYGPVERTIGAAWEVLTHDIVPTVGRTVPIFGTILDRKLLGQRSAYESYLEDQAYGTDFHDWTKPYESMIEPRLEGLMASDPLTATAGGAGLGLFLGATPAGVITGAVGAVTMGLGSAFRSSRSGQLRGGDPPSEFKEEAKLEAYFDALQYEKFARLRDKAYESDDPEQKKLAGVFRRKMDRTSVGFRYDLKGDAFYDSAKFRLGAPMKDYAWQMLQAPEGTRESIMRVAPDLAKPILSSAWRRQGGEGYVVPKGSPRERAQEILQAKGVPDKGWEGWSPHVTMDAIKVRTLDSYYNTAYDMHKHDLWASDRVMADRQHPHLRPAF